MKHLATYITEKVNKYKDGEGIVAAAFEEVIGCELKYIETVRYRDLSDKQKPRFQGGIDRYISIYEIVSGIESDKPIKVLFSQAFRCCIECDGKYMKFDDGEEYFSTSGYRKNWPVSKELIQQFVKSL